MKAESAHLLCECMGPICTCGYEARRIRNERFEKLEADIAVFRRVVATKEELNVKLRDELARPIEVTSTCGKMSGKFKREGQVVAEHIRFLMDDVLKLRAELEEIRTAFGLHPDTEHAQVIDTIEAVRHEARAYPDLQLQRDEARAELARLRTELQQLLPTEERN